MVIDMQDAGRAYNDKVVNSRPRKRKPAPLVLHGDAEGNRRDLGAKR